MNDLNYIYIIQNSLKFEKFFKLFNKNEIDLNKNNVTINIFNKNKQRKNNDQQQQQQQQQYVINNNNNKKKSSKFENVRPYNYKQSTGGEIEVHLIVHYYFYEKNKKKRNAIHFYIDI